MVRRLRGGDAKALHGVRHAAEETASAWFGSTSHRNGGAGRSDRSQPLWGAMTRADATPGLRYALLLALLLVGCLLLSPLFLLLVSQGGCSSSSLGARSVRRRREICRRVRWCGGSSHRAIRRTLRRGSWETSSRKASSTPRRRAAGWLSGNPRGTARWSRTPRLSACHPRPTRVSSRISSTTCAPATAACWQAWTPLRTRAPPRRCSRPPTSSARVWWVTWT